jgi:hypothetical protein
MKYLIVALALLLQACSTPVPVTAKFPEVPPRLLEACPQLKKLDEKAEPKLSGVATVVTDNYGTYYECAVKNDAWIEWYQIQKIIFEGAGK